MLRETRDLRIGGAKFHSAVCRGYQAWLIAWFSKPFLRCFISCKLNSSSILFVEAGQNCEIQEKNCFLLTN